MGESSGFLATKFMPPRVGERMVQREALLTRLRECPECRLVLITGYPGFGKSTLMAQWRLRLAATGARIAWVSLDPSDRQPERFIAGLHGALAHAGVALDPATARTSDIAGMPRALSGLVNALTSLRGELYLMIDDLHRADDPGIVGLLQMIVDAAVPRLHVVVASRAMPALQVGRLRAAGELAQVDAGDLLFLHGETTAFLHKWLGHAVDADLACHLHEQTEGWPAGLHLSLESLRKGRRGITQPGKSAFPFAGLKAYLSEDALAGVPEELHVFMRRLSVLRRFRADLAAAVTGVPRAAEMLGDIAARGLFLLPATTEEAGSWYRFHPMFNRFLRQGLAGEPAEAKRVHRRAFEWFVGHDMQAEAVRHALACGEPELAVSLAERELTADTQAAVGSLGWTAQHVPPQQFARHRSLLRMGAWACVLSVQPEQASAWLALIEMTPGGAGLARERHLLHAMMAAYRDDPIAARAAMEQVGHTPIDDAPFAERLRLALHMWWLAEQGDHSAVRRLFNSRVACVLRQSSDELALLGVTTAAIAAMLEGNVLLADRIGSPVLAQAEDVHGRRSVSACVCAATMAMAWYEMDRIGEACQALANRMDRLQRSPPEVTWRATLTKARLIALLETPREALAYLSRAEACWRAAGFERGVALTLSEQIRIALVIRDIRYAQDMLCVLDDISRRHDADHAATAGMRTLADISSARLALATGAPAQALVRLADAQAWAEHYGRGLDQVTVTLLKAVAYDCLGRRADTEQSLIAAVATGYRLGLQRTFLDEGDQLRELLARLRGSVVGDLAGYLAALTGVSEDGSATGLIGSTTFSEFGNQQKREPSLLSEREIEIVSLLAQSMSNKRIALVLDLSVQTVKWNLKRIFSKLDVSCRYEAVVAARTQGIRLSLPQ